MTDDSHGFRRLVDEGSIDPYRFTVDPWDGGPRPFPAMEWDRGKVDPVLPERFGLGGCDVIVRPIHAQTNPKLSGRIDSPDAFRAFGDLLASLRHASPFDGKLAATRWSDFDPGRETFSRAVDRFRGETSAPAGERHRTLRGW